MLNFPALDRRASVWPLPPHSPWPLQYPTAPQHPHSPPAPTTCVCTRGTSSSRLAIMTMGSLELGSWARVRPDGGGDAMEKGGGRRAGVGDWGGNHGWLKYSKKVYLFEQQKRNRNRQIAWQIAVSERRKERQEVNKILQMVIYSYRTSELQSRTPFKIKHDIMPRRQKIINVGAAEEFFAAILRFFLICSLIFIVQGGY